MKKSPWLISVIIAVIYFVTFNLTRLIFLDRPFDLIESITGAIVMGILYYLFHKYIGHKINLVK